MNDRQPFDVPRRLARGATARLGILPWALVWCLSGTITFQAQFQAQLQAQDQPGSFLSLSQTQAIVGGTFSLFLEARADQPFRGFQVGVEFPGEVMTLEDVSLFDTEMARSRPEVFEFFFTSERDLLVRVIHDDSPPFEQPFEAGVVHRLLRLDFRLPVGITSPPGGAASVGLLRTVGSPPVASTFIGLSGDSPPDRLEAGTVSIVDDNFLRILNTDGIRVGETAFVEIAGLNLEPLQGFSLAIRFDPKILELVDADLEGTITASVGAEYVAPLIDNDEGSLGLGVLLDQVPPFDSQEIPIAGFEMPLARLRFRVLATTEDSAGTDIRFVESVGEPAIRNRFVIYNKSVPAQTQSGRLSFLFQIPFLRGDVNEDGLVDLSDSVKMLQWIILGMPGPVCEKAGDTDDSGVVESKDIIHLLFYLFRGGDVIAPPFPGIGLDPTPDELFCHS